MCRRPPGSRAANGRLGSHGGAPDTECPGAGAQPSFSSAMSGTVFYSKVDKRAANKKKAMWESEEKKREVRGGGGGNFIQLI